MTGLNETEFARRVVEMRGTLYRVCYGLLRSEADREDAVSECVRKGASEAGKRFGMKARSGRG